MAISVKNITKFYGDQKALDSISFEIKKGEVVGFLGPNGAGKSTLMKILTTYLLPDKGDAFVNGFSVLTQKNQVKKSVGYLPENNPLYYDMYVREYLTFLARLYKLTDKRVETMINKTGLSPEAHKKIGQLSKGYKQRVGLAAALIHNPEVLLLDEPTTGLDPNQLEEIRTLIKNSAREEGRTILFSTHIMQEVEAICDRVIIINKGRIAYDDSLKNTLKEKNITELFTALTTQK